MEPPTPTPTPIKKPVKPCVISSRPKPATLVKPSPQSKKLQSTAEIMIIENEKPSEQVSRNPLGRILQPIDLQKLSRLSCSREFSLFHREIKRDLKTNEHQLTFFQTKLHHLKDEFIDQTSQQVNLQQIRDYFVQSLHKNIQRKIQPDEFITLANKLQQDIKQVRFLFE
jgi:hypothetical protein